LEKKDYLTNERLKYKFYSFFDLANYAIQRAKEKIKQEETVTLFEIIDILTKLPDEMKEKKV